MKVLAALIALSLTSPALSLDVRDARLVDVLGMLAMESGRNVVADATVPQTRVTLHLSGVTFDEALAVIASSQGLLVRRVGGAYVVGAAGALNRAEGRDVIGAGTSVFPLERADAQDVARELVDALPVGTVVVADRRTRSVVVSAETDIVERAKRLIAALDGPVRKDAGTSTETVALRYLRAGDALKLAKDALPADVVAIADDTQNALLLEGPRDGLARAEAVVASLDVPARQVVFEVRVADVTPADDSSTIGFEFGGMDAQGRPSAGSATYAFPRGTLAVNAKLNAMVVSGRAQILATPRLVALNNREADLLIGQTYPIVYSTSAFGGQEVQFVDVGVKLRLTPTIGADGSVTADLHPEYSEIEGFAAGDLPIIANRKIDSTLRVRSDETIVLGGLMRDVSSETITKLPGLGDIPILGAFFRNKAARHQRNEIVFLITPHVVEPGEAPPSS